jgi:hypothetical protein
VFWTVTGAALVAYEVWAIARGRTKVTTYSHRSPQNIIVLGWWAGLGYHFYRDWRRERTR